jgi:uncharacterized protein (TIGR01777 family)
MIAAIAGSNGFLGKALIERSPDIEWRIINREILYGEKGMLKERIRGADAVINLAGSPISKRWTKKNRREIIKSRLEVNTHIVEAINGLAIKPSLFITASAIGFYDIKGVHDETDFIAGKGFLAETVKLWERPLDQLDGSVNAVRARIGIVLGMEGGALNKLLKLARFKILPIMGSGRQISSFIHIEDLVGAIRFILQKKPGGVYNLCTPFPVDNATFTRILTKKRRIPFVFRIPTPVLKLMLGSSHVLVSEGPHVLPARLIQEGFNFRYPGVEDAIQNLVEEP